MGDKRDPATPVSWLRPTVVQYGVEGVVSDDLSSCWVMVEQLGVERQRCRFHLMRWIGRQLRNLETELDSEHRWVLPAVRVILDRMATIMMIEPCQVCGSRCAGAPHPRTGPRTVADRLWRCVGWLSDRWSSIDCATGVRTCQPPRTGVNRRLGESRSEAGPCVA